MSMLRPALLALFAGQAWGALDWSLLAENGVQSLAAADHPGAMMNPAKIIPMKPKYFTDMGSKRVKIEYGPYMAPGASAAGNGQRTFVESHAVKPCSDCLITFMRAGLQYPNGSNANADSGMWLHNGVMLDSAERDTVCPDGIPGLKGAPNRFYAIGNERAAANLCNSGESKTGYFLSNSSRVSTLIELMNGMPEAREAVFTVEYEFIPEPVPAEFKHVKSIWLDAGGCERVSETEVPGGQPNVTFELSMPTPWQVPVGWKENIMVTSVGGHLHDGGSHLMAMKNGESFCDMIPTYGGTHCYIGMPRMNQSMTQMGGDMEMGRVAHISSISSCRDATMIQEGDELSIHAVYNTTRHEAMLDMNGAMEPVIGISVLYAAKRNASTAHPQAVGLGGSTTTATPLPADGSVVMATGTPSSANSAAASSRQITMGGLGAAAAVVFSLAAGFAGCLLM